MVSKFADFDYFSSFSTRYHQTAASAILAATYQFIGKKISGPPLQEKKSWFVSQDDLLQSFINVCDDAIACIGDMVCVID